MLTNSQEAARFINSRNKSLCRVIHKNAKLKLSEKKISFEGMEKTLKLKNKRKKPKNH